MGLHSLFTIGKEAEDEITITDSGAFSDERDRVRRNGTHQDHTITSGSTPNGDYSGGEPTHMQIEKNSKLWPVSVYHTHDY